jgi:hypothetical protein
MISRARRSAIVFSACAAVSAAVAWYLAWMSGCLRRNASLRLNSLTSLFASVPSSQARCRPQARPRSVPHARAAASNVSWTRSAASSRSPRVRTHAWPNSHRSCAAKKLLNSATCGSGILTSPSSLTPHLHGYLPTGALTPAEVH